MIYSELYSKPLKAPKGFKLGMIHSNVADLKWNRPDDLANSYSIVYRPLRMGDEGQHVEMSVSVGKRGRAGC